MFHCGIIVYLEAELWQLLRIDASRIKAGAASLPRQVQDCQQFDLVSKHTPIQERPRPSSHLSKYERLNHCARCPPGPRFGSKGRRGQQLSHHGLCAIIPLRRQCSRSSHVRQDWKIVFRAAQTFWLGTCSGPPTLVSTCDLTSPSADSVPSTRPSRSPRQRPLTSLCSLGTPFRHSPTTRTVCLLPAG